MVIEIRRVSKRFGDFVAVDEADFGIRRGEFFSMLGPSGCGKTTTLRMIAGFEQPSSGEVRLDGQDVSRVPPYKRHVNTVFQQYALFPHMSVFDNVAFGPRSTKVPKGEIDERVQAFLARPIEGDWPYVWLDATYVKVRRNHRIVSTAVIVAGIMLAMR